MVKMIFVTCLVTLSSFSPIFVNAQILGGFFSQKKTQRKYLLAQIAALQTYIKYAKDGYNIVNGGLSTIKGIKNGDLNIHSTFFNSLKIVSPAVKKNKKLLDLISLQLSLVQYCQSDDSRWNGLTGKQITSVEKIHAQLIKSILNDIRSLTDIITDNTFEMNDNERLSRIEALYIETVEKHGFISKMHTDLQMIASQQLHNNNEIINLENLIGK